MSDVSKTNEALIAEAQQHYSEMNGLNSRAAEVMMELVAALEAKTGVRVDMSSAVGVEAQLAATRVPVQGEPNDDRTPEFEAIEQELFKHQPLLSMQDGSIRGCKCMDRVFVTKTEDWGTHLAEVFTRLSRATVPDAAPDGQVIIPIARIQELREAKDAATEAIERVRVIHGPSDEFPAGCDYCERLTPCSTVAALDEAPEPEWEYGEIGPANQVHMTTPERVRKSEALGWSQEIVRRYTAGPWVSVKVGDIGE